MDGVQWIAFQLNTQCWGLYKEPSGRAPSQDKQICERVLKEEYENNTIGNLGVMIAAVLIWSTYAFTMIFGATVLGYLGYYTRRMVVLPKSNGERATQNI